MADGEVIGEEIAYAKVTLGLRVVGTRTDGFHDIEALTVFAMTPHDRVTVSVAANTDSTVSVHGTGAVGVPEDDRNLALRAWVALSELAPLPPVHIDIEKRIPAGAGLGGGSADAAAVIRIASRFSAISLDVALSVAADLGSDIPVCIQQSAAWMRGRGEHLTPAAFEAAAPFLILTTPFPCSTPAVYSAWDDLDKSQQTGREIPIPKWLRSQVDHLGNDLTDAAVRVAPELGALMAAVETCTGEAPLLLGSGSSLAVFPEEDDVEATASLLQGLDIDFPGLACIRTQLLACPTPWDH